MRWSVLRRTAEVSRRGARRSSGICYPQPVWRDGGGLCILNVMRMNISNKVLLVVVAILVVVLAAVFVWREQSSQGAFYAVYLRTGDLYFGKLTRFPTFALSQVYLLQVNQQDQQNPLSVQRFRDVFWGPEDRLTLNREDIVWYTRLRSDSQLAQLLKTNPTLSAPAAAQQPQAQPAQAQVPVAPQPVSPAPSPQSGVEQ